MVAASERRGAGDRCSRRQSVCRTQVFRAQAAGRHELDLVNSEFGFRTSRVVQVTAGKIASIKAEMPNGTIAVNAVPWAEVWIDGQAVGETPIGNVTVPIGNHDVVFRHPELGE